MDYLHAVFQQNELIIQQQRIILERQSRYEMKIDHLEGKITNVEKIGEKRIITDRRKSMTLTEAARIVGKSRRTVERWVEEGKVEIVPGSKPLRVTVSSVNKLQ